MLSWCCWLEFVNMEVWSCNTGGELCWFWYFSCQNRAQLLARVTVLWGRVCVSLLSSPDVLLTFFFPLILKASTLVVAEHEGGALKNSSLSAVAAAAALGEGSTVSLLVGGSGPLLRQAVAHAAKAHPAITQVHNLTNNYLLLPRHRFRHLHSWNAVSSWLNLAWWFFLLWFCCGLQNLHLHLLHQVKITTYLRVC